MQLIASFIERVLQEGRWEHETTQASRVIMGRIRQMVDERRLEPIETSIEGMRYIMSVKRGRSLNVSGTYVFASDDRQPRIELTVHIPRGWSIDRFKDNLSDMQHDLKTTVRHELEHAAQDRAGRMTSSYGDVDPSLRGYNYMRAIMLYFLDRSELEAVAAHLYKGAKMKKQPVGNELDELLDLVEKSMLRRDVDNMLARAATAKIEKALRDEMMKRFPRAVFDVTRS